MSGVFVSYSRQDKAAADYLAAELRNRGADVFVDYQRLVAGENFIKRIGREIESRDWFVLLVSPRSVASKWVQAEVAWAFHSSKPIIPVLLEPAPLVDCFFLINLEQVDFTRWSLDGQIGDAVYKLATVLDLPQDPVIAATVPEIIVRKTDVAVEVNDEEIEPAQSCERRDLRDLFLTASEVADRDPEQALFLYHRVLEIDPDFSLGQAKAFVQREEERLKPVRLEWMKAQAEKLMAIGDWRHAKRIGQDMLALDAKNTYAKPILVRCAKNVDCEPNYLLAKSAAEKGQWGAVITLLRDLLQTCPDYGDPAGILRRRPLQTQLVGYVRQLYTLTGHKDPVCSVAFSPDGTLLASGSGDATIRLWDVSLRRELTALTGHKGGVRSVAFSPDGALLASGSDDWEIRLWGFK